MFQLVKQEKFVFKMAVTSSKGEVNRIRARNQDCDAVLA